MNLYIADKNINVIAVIDCFKSIIWDNRYNKCGDFELDIPFTYDVKEICKQDYYIWRDKDVYENLIVRPKIIEHIELINNVKDNYLHITGRDVTSILNYRAVYPMEQLDGKVDTCIYNLIDKCVINPVEVNRKIELFEVPMESTIDDTINAQVTGDYIMDYIEKVCNDYKIGFRTDLDITTKKFLFSIYKGRDKTDLNDNPVIFSRDIDNVLKIEYVNDNASYKNMAIVAGMGEGVDRKVVRINDDLAGLERRELFVDAKDLQNTDSEGHTIPDETYIENLTQRGSEKLSESEQIINNGCEVEPNTNFIFNIDYFVGDKVIVDGYEKINERIIETTESETPTGTKVELVFEEEKDD